MKNMDNLPKVDLMFEPFCQNCEQAKLKVIDGDRIYAGNTIYQITTSLTCEHIQACRRLYKKICKVEENASLTYYSDL